MFVERILTGQMRPCQRGPIATFSVLSFLVEEMSQTHFVEPVPCGNDFFSQPTLSANDLPA
jgi:hypothetical protein